MVFPTLQLFGRCRGPDEFWRKRKIFKLAAHFRGRQRNCYSLAIRAVHRALQYATIGRSLKKKDLRELWDSRINSACQQHNINSYNFVDGLYKYDVLINRKTLSEVSTWEPRTFKALTDIAALKKNVNDNYEDSETKHIFLSNNIDDYVRPLKK